MKFIMADGINVLLYLALIMGAVLLFFERLTGLIYKAKIARRMRAAQGKGGEETKSVSPRGKLFVLLKATTRIKSERALSLYIALNILLGFLLFIPVQAVLGAPIALAAGGAVACIPTILLRTRLQNMRINVSREGEILVTEVLNYYKMHYCNMYEAIEQASYGIREAPNSKRVLMNLSNGLSTAATDEEVKELLWDFNYSIGTSWAVILSNNMYFALTDGIKVTAALSDLTDSIAKARKALEQNRRENNEAKLMLKYLVPASYLLTIVAANRFFGFSIGKFMEYQFMTKAGLSWFMGCSGAFLVSMIAMAFLSRVKMDL
ncbi:MAG: hypothetical protein GX663_09920 [Clostridiales bacterium]|nr:hypothetical protein [Clostridiales bacterium]